MLVSNNSRDMALVRTGREECSRNASFHDQELVSWLIFVTGGKGKHGQQLPWLEVLETIIMAIVMSPS